MTFDIEKLDKMRVEFENSFDFLFDSGFKRLNRALKIKLSAIKYCKNFMKGTGKTAKFGVKSKLSGKSLIDKSYKNIHKLFYSQRGSTESKHLIEEDVKPENFTPMFLFEIDELSSLFDSDEYLSSSSNSSSSFSGSSSEH